MRSVVLVLVLVLTSLAGCLQAAEIGPPAGGPEADAAARAHVVVGVVDSGINPYHVQFRDHGPEAWLHPSTYLEGYPADAPALNVSLDEPEWGTAVGRDCALWNGLQPDVLYWVPGTRIVGLRIDPAWPAEAVDCEAGEIPEKGLEGLGAHGTGAAGRAVGATTSLCPECKVVMSQGVQNTHAMRWMAGQSWVDLQSNSWAGFLCHQVPGAETIGCDRGPREYAREATEAQVTFIASGNGIRPRYSLSVPGVATVSVPDIGVGVPAYLKPGHGHPGVIVVGGHDNGQLLLWPGTLPHVVADSWAHPSASWNGTRENGTFGGTSGSTPFAAGVFARILLEARRLLDDTGTGLRGEDLAVAGRAARLPGSGPLADGALSRAEAETLLLRTAAARPTEDAPYDGGLGGCAPGDCVSTFLRTGVDWSALPDEAEAYYFLGYGQVGSRSLAAALAVLNGAAALPERPAEDRFFAADAALRAALAG